ncbi:MAG: GNAT family N-acetyltransferase [Limnochordaceae bacterium]|nr:GNAT family N-acetyltransferase [Limnochordaceae bacterium]
MWRVIPEGTALREHALLRDGSWVLIRTASPADVPAVEALMARLSHQTLRMRFFAGVSQVSRTLVEQLCAPPSRDQVSLLAIWGEGPDERVVGVGNYVALPGRNTAEVAFVVDDAFQGRGIGTLLLERLAGMAAGSGLVGFEAEVLFENRPMVEVFRESGFQVRQALDGGVLHIQFPVATTAAARERAELRERIAAANSLVPLLRPRRVAVVGASRDPDSVGGMVFRYILQAGFTGTVYPVNRSAASVYGVRAYPSVEALPEPVELVIVAVPADQVLEVARSALQAGARGLVVLTAGFAEAGPEGAERQRALVQLVRSRGARMVGPNCLGLINTDPEIRLNASLAPSLAPRGRIGFFSHSGALGLVILAYAKERGLGFSTFVSAGNRADVSGNDLLEYWDEDPQTDMALLYLETFGNPRRFARIARRLSARKPVLCVKSARSRAGVRAAQAHIGAVAAGEEEVEALFRQAGVIRADTLEEMFDVAVLLAHQPLPQGNRVSIVTNSGGVATIAADTCEARGSSSRGLASSTWARWPGPSGTRRRCGGRSKTPRSMPSSPYSPAWPAAIPAR